MTDDGEVRILSRVVQHCPSCPDYDGPAEYEPLPDERLRALVAAVQAVLDSERDGTPGLDHGVVSFKALLTLRKANEALVHGALLGPAEPHPDCCDTCLTLEANAAWQEHGHACSRCKLSPAEPSQKGEA